MINDNDKMILPAKLPEVLAAQKIYLKLRKQAKIFNPKLIKNQYIHATILFS